MHVLVPGSWSVRRAHDVVDDIEQSLQAEFQDLEITTHIEPREDPRAYDDFGDYEVPIQPLTDDHEETP